MPLKPHQQTSQWSRTGGAIIVDGALRVLGVQHAVRVHRGVVRHAVLERQPDGVAHRRADGGAQQAQVRVLGRAVLQRT